MAIKWVAEGLPQPWEMGVPWRETSNSGGRSVTVQLMCDWDDRLAIQDDLEFNTNLEWPYRAAGSGMYVAQVECMPAEESKERDGYGWVHKHAILSVTYAQNNRDVGPLGGVGNEIAFFEESIEPAGEFVTLDYRLFKWKATGKKLKQGEAPGRLVLCNAYTVHWFKLPNASALRAARAAVNHVNRYEVYSTTFDETFAPGTLLLAGSPQHRTVTSNAGSRYFDCTIRCLIREESWNKFWSADYGNYDSFVKAEGGADYNSYPSIDMSGFLP